MDPAVLREDMVDSLEHEAKGFVESDRVGIAMRTVPREAFVDEERSAYEDRDLEHQGSRVLSPSSVARLLEALSAEEDDDVLVVGAGVGYTAAVLAEIVGEPNVHAIDIDRRLVLTARSNLAEAGYGGVLVDRRDGADGLPEYASYDRVLLEAAAVRPPRALLDQLADDGRLVMPSGNRQQTLVAVDRDGKVRDRFGPVRFEPLLVSGEETSAIERNRTVREDRERAERANERRKGWEHDWIDWDGV
ncbi:protein-L-isoaspartate O-methyltransferase [Halobacteriales archaeon QS_1_68_20]|nr:MAG: protein-L-isoaspartate O-methyltransferase [Halobacteriales archaeon QS_1_68_20]